MQIFVTDLDPKISATNLDNKRCCKMIIESSQLLSSSLYINKYLSELQTPCKPGWLWHPLTKWTSECSANFTWLFNHFSELLREYTIRYNKIHSFKQHANIYSKYIEHHSSPNYFYNATIFKDSNEDICTIYQKYLNWKYSKQKYPPKWTNTNPPIWYNKNILQSKSQVV